MTGFIDDLEIWEASLDDETDGLLEPTANTTHFLVEHLGKLEVSEDSFLEELNANFVSSLPIIKKGLSDEYMVSVFYHELEHYDVEHALLGPGIITKGDMFYFRDFQLRSLDALLQTACFMFQAISSLSRFSLSNPSILISSSSSSAFSCH